MIDTNTAAADSSARTQSADDKALVARAAEGDERAFSQLVRRHYERALRVAFGIVKCHVEAEDVVQEAFIRVHGRLRDFEGSSAFYTWLYRIVVNVSIDAMRKRRRERRVDLQDEAGRDALGSATPLWAASELEHPAAGAERMQLRRTICRALERLPDIHQSVIVLREVEGQSYEEIAHILNLKKGTVMSRLFHARRALQRHLQTIEAEQHNREERWSVRRREAGATPIEYAASRPHRSDRSRKRHYARSQPLAAVA